jgi:ADP-dependent NAD(P)H-hydrate dehydratase / NAD(P)H-hydrate epimerase
MKIFKGDQIKRIDQLTISGEPVASVDLMERAAQQLFRWYISKFERSAPVHIFAGPGNNGGDGLALARLLSDNRFNVKAYCLNFGGKTTEDRKKNLERLKTETSVHVSVIETVNQFPFIRDNDIIIDAIFGSGLTRKAEGLASEVIQLINRSDSKVISIDIPSGLFGEDNSENDYSGVISAEYTLSFQFPKLAFMFPENAAYTGQWVILPIGLSKAAIHEIDSPYYFSEKKDIVPLLKSRAKFDHKGNYGHGLLIAGSYGKMGAAILGSMAALRAGIGLLTCHIPSSGIPILQTAIPEAMADADSDEKLFSSVTDTGSYNTIGIGPGIGTDTISQNSFHQLLLSYRKPMVIDADGLNMLSMNKEWFSLVPENSVLTPHPKEFERLAGKTSNSFDRLKKQIEFSNLNNCIVVLKGANTSITTPGGKVYFNSTGNPGMATAGSGDALTGILLSLMAQGYMPETAAVLGVYLHGLAGDIAAGESSQESIIASDIIKCLGKAFNSLREQ